MTSLGALVERLAPVVLSSLLPLEESDRSRDIGEVVLFDGEDVAAVSSGDLVLCVGVRRADQLVAVGRALAARGPAAIVVRTDVVDDEVAAALATQVPLLAVDPSASWMQLTTLVREVLSSDEPGTGSDDQSSDDLFRTANAIAELVDAPVTIEDPQSRVLAFSEDQDRADPARRDTILGRKAPEVFHSRMRQHGVYKRLHSATTPMFVAGRPPDVLPRVVMPVRAGGEFLGSIWAVIQDQPTREQEEALVVAARTVALQLLRQRFAADSWRAAETASLHSLLQGGTGAEETARRLGLAATGYQVVAVSAQLGGSLDGDAVLLRLMHGLRLSLSALHRQSLLAKLGEQLYAVVPVPEAKSLRRPDPDVRQFVDQFAKRHTKTLSTPVHFGLGAVVASVRDLPRSRNEADRVLRVLMRDPRSSSVADIVQVGDQALLDLVMDALSSEPSLGSDVFARILEHDEARNTQFAETLLAWIDCFGDTYATASVLVVHPNTVRYRIRQVRALGLTDLDDAAERLALQLHLRRWQSARASGASSGTPT